jgi:hypothetical protein
MYYVIKKDDLYFNDIMGGWDTFMPWGSLFPPKRIDEVWREYLTSEERHGAVIYQVNIQETDIQYTPKHVTEKDIYEA